MTFENSELYKTWALRASLAIAVIVIALSWLNMVRIPYILMRGAVSFGVMYFLLAGSLYLFEKGASPREAEERDEALNPDAGRGTMFDAAVGDDRPFSGRELDQNAPQGLNRYQNQRSNSTRNRNEGRNQSELNSDLKESVDPSQVEGFDFNQDFTNNGELGQEIGMERELGQDQDFGRNPELDREQDQDRDKLSAGQVDPGLSEGLPDGERQAEIVRRMGWEE